MWCLPMARGEHVNSAPRYCWRRTGSLLQSTSQTDGSDDDEAEQESPLVPLMQSSPFSSEIDVSEEIQQMQSSPVYSETDVSEDEVQQEIQQMQKSPVYLETDVSEDEVQQEIQQMQSSPVYSKTDVSEDEVQQEIPRMQSTPVSLKTHISKNDGEEEIQQMPSSPGVSETDVPKETPQMQSSPVYSQTDVSENGVEQETQQRLPSSPVVSGIDAILDDDVEQETQQRLPSSLVSSGIDVVLDDDVAQEMQPKPRSLLIPGYRSSNLLRVKFVPELVQRTVKVADCPEERAKWRDYNLVSCGKCSTWTKEMQTFVVRDEHGDRDLFCSKCASVWSDIVSERPGRGGVGNLKLNFKRRMQQETPTSQSCADRMKVPRQCEELQLKELSAQLVMA
ncbi:unnamed protein product [Durusdinium trenchii]|uniref:Uncharacterized protein n=1 Tax=Durusdinium trenchii TaxID=1381693 RepID=A0ABP0SR21_9DINO